MRITLCENPFNLSRDQRAIELLPGETVGDALAREGLAGSFTVVRSGETLSAEDGLHYVPVEGDDVHVVQTLENATLRTIALIGVAAAGAFFTAGLGSFIGGTLFTALTTGAQNAIAATIISVGGSLLVNGIASLFAKKPGGSNYGVLGPQTVARSGIPIPKGYGTIRSGGNIVESWVDIQGNNGDGHDVDDGADTIGRQYVNVRVDYGFGPARSLSDIRINDKDIANYADVSYAILYGTNDQTPITANDSRWVQLNITTTGTTTNTQPTVAFDAFHNNYPLMQRVRAGVDRNYVVVPGQRTDTQRLDVFVTFNQGVWRYDGDMVLKRLGISYNVYYRPAGSGEAGWIFVPAPNGDTPNGETHYYYNIRQTLLRQCTTIDNLAPGCYDIKVEKIGSGPPDNPLVYAEMESSKFGDQLWIESVQETSYTTLAYPNKIQIVLRFMATDQLAGSEVSVSAVIEYGLRSTLPALLSDLSENNPAAVAYDILSDGMIGAGLPDSRIDLNFLRDWADLSLTPVDNGDGGTQPFAVFNGVFDQDGMSVWDAVSAVAVMSYANLTRVGAKVTGWLDKVDDPVMMFSVGNIINYSKTYLNLDDRAQEVDVDFADAADDYKTRNPVRVMLEKDLASSEALKRTRVNLLGCTDRVQGYYWATHKLLESETVIRTHTWESNANAIRARSGNVVLLQYDVPGWPFGGLIQQGSTASTLVLDRTDLPFDTSAAYTVMVVHPALKVATATVSGNTGGTLALSGYTGTAAQRVTQGAIDQNVSSYTSGSIVPDDPTAFAVGSSVDLWALDAMETATVQSATVREQTTIVTLSAPLAAVPVSDSAYIYQTVDRQAKPVRIKQIKKKLGEQRYTIVGVDYSADTYSIPAPSAGMSYTPPPSGTDGTGGTGNPATGNTSQAILAVNYTSSGDYFNVQSIVIQTPGSGYTSASTATLSSGYDDIQVVNDQPVEVTDPTQNLTLTLDGNGAITGVTGYDQSTNWNGSPYVTLTK